MIGGRLREERSRLGLNQSQAALRLGIPPVTYRTYESGRSVPPLLLMERLREAGFDPQFVAFGERLHEVIDRGADWSLLSALAEVIHEWSSGRPRPLSQEEKGNYLRLAYEWAVTHPVQSANDVVRHLLRIA